MAFRLLRICSTQELFDFRLDELKTEVLIPRDYKISVITKAFAEVRKIDRKDALKKVEKNEKNDRIVVPLDYSPYLPKQGLVLKKHYNAMIRKNTSLKRIFPKPPMAGLRQGKNLRRLLCKPRLYPKISERPTRQSRTAPGWSKCAGNKKPCPICPITANPTSVVTSDLNGYTHIIKDQVNCQSKNVIYQWKCKKQNCKDHPKNTYIGKTTQTFQQRFSQYRDYVTR